MDEILASIRSYVAEGQNFPKSATETYKIQDNQGMSDAKVIQLTEEVIPIQTIDLQSNASKNSPLAFSENENIKVQSQSFDNPFNRLQSEIKASTPAPSTLSVDDLLSQLATPLIKNWMDLNLRKIVETIVEKEIERMRRG